MPLAETSADKAGATPSAKRVAAPNALTSERRNLSADKIPALNPPFWDGNPPVAETPIVPGLTGLEEILPTAEAPSPPPVVGPGQADSGAVVTETGFKPLAEPFAGGVDLTQLKSEPINDGKRDGYSAQAAGVNNLQISPEAGVAYSGVAPALAKDFSSKGSINEISHFNVPSKIPVVPDLQQRV